MRVSPFWRSGLTFSLLLLAVLPAIDFYSTRELRQEAFDGGEQELAALARVARANPPDAGNPPALVVWLTHIAASGVRVWLLSNDGQVIADSSAPEIASQSAASASIASKSDESETVARRPAPKQDPAPRRPPLPPRSPAATSDDQNNLQDDVAVVLQPEFRQALLAGEGHAVRHDAAIGRDVVYWAVRLDPAPPSQLAPASNPAAAQAAASQPSSQPSNQPSAATDRDAPVYLRLALPLVEVDSAITRFRWRLWSASLILLLFVGGGSLVVARSVSRRIRQLKEFSQPRCRAVTFVRSKCRPAAMNSMIWPAPSMRPPRQLDGTIRVLTDERNRSAAILGSMIEGVAVISAAGARAVLQPRVFADSRSGMRLPSKAAPLVEVVRQSDLLAVIKKGAGGARRDLERDRRRHRAVREVSRSRRRRCAPTAPPAPCWCCTTSASCGASSACARISSPMFRTNFARRSPRFRVLRRRFWAARWTIPQPPPLRRNHPQPCRSPGAPDRGPAQAFAHRSRAAGSGVPARVGPPTRRVLRGDGAVESRAKTT